MLLILKTDYSCIAYAWFKEHLNVTILKLRDSIHGNCFNNSLHSLNLLWLNHFTVFQIKLSKWQILSFWRFKTRSPVSDTGSIPIKLPYQILFTNYPYLSYMTVI